MAIIAGPAWGAPTIEQTGPLSVTMGEDNSINDFTQPAISATDPDGAPSWSIATYPSNGFILFTPGTGFTIPEFKYEPTRLFNGVDSFTFKATGSLGGEASITVNVTVTPGIDVPEFLMGPGADFIYASRGHPTVASYTYNSLASFQRWNLLLVNSITKSIDWRPYSRSTTIAGWIGGEGIDDGKFLKPVGVAVDNDDNVYVVDSVRKDVQKFDATANFLLKWGADRFVNPIGLAADRFGNVYVLDAFLGEVHKFDTNGAFLLKWGSGRFARPVGLAVGPTGDVYILVD